MQLAWPDELVVAWPLASVSAPPFLMLTSRMFVAGAQGELTGTTSSDQVSLLTLLVDAKLKITYRILC